MVRKKRKYESNIPDADKWMKDKKLKDIKRECVIRGLEFENVISLSIPNLMSWLRFHFDNPCKHELLDLFDDWQEAQVIEALKSKNEDPNSYIHAALRLGYIAEKDDDGNTIKRKRVKVVFARKKQKRERTDEGLFAGTKKAYTYQLQKEGISKADTVKKVLAQFPEASTKSVGIWWNKSRKLKN